jgi:hypothetical protein
MAAYRFYYLNEHDHIIDAEWVFCPDDKAAMAHAAGKLLTRGDSHDIEIWQERRRVDAIARPPEAASRLRRAA